MTLPVIGNEYKLPFNVEVSISNEGRTDVPVEDMVVGNSIVFTALVE